MIQAYVDNKDVYVEIASLAFGVPYEECLEHRPDGTVNPDGKARRGASKRIVLGILYGRQIKSIADQLGVSVKEAQRIYDSVLANFPELAEFIQKTQDFAREHGYVETIWGRRRQLPEMQLPLYEFSYADGVSKDFDPLSDEESDTEVSYDDCVKYTNMLYYAKTYKQKQAIFENLRQQGINIKDNSSKIADAERQCVNCVDYNTEILTANGWKKYNEIHIGDKILSYNMNKKTHCTDNSRIEIDTVTHIHIYDGEHDVIKISNPNFDAVMTPNHRCIVFDSESNAKFVYASELIQEEYTIPIGDEDGNIIPLICSPKTCKIEHISTNGVWCVTTVNGTWIARRDGKVFYTGNSVVQGSAADLTKLAMIELYNNQELKDLGFKMLIPVHDEIIAECPSVNSGRCAELMSQCMLHAGKDLCVPLKCDVDAFYHWYGETLDPQTLKPLSEH